MRANVLSDISLIGSNTIAPGSEISSHHTIILSHIMKTLKVLIHTPIGLFTAYISCIADTSVYMVSNNLRKQLTQPDGFSIYCEKQQKHIILSPQMTAQTVIEVLDTSTQSTLSLAQKRADVSRNEKL